MSINTAKTILGGVLPFAANPIVLAVIGAGAAAWAVSTLFNDNEEQSEEDNQPGTVPDGYEPLSEPLNQTYSTVPAIVSEQLETVQATAETTAANPFVTDGNEDSLDISDDLEQRKEEVVKKELIRQAMSELGKRSAIARRSRANK